MIIAGFSLVPRHFFHLILCYKKGIMQLIFQYLIDFM